MVDLRELEWADRVAKIRELIQFSNDNPALSLRNISRHTKLSESSAMRILCGYTHKNEVRATGLDIGVRGRSRGPRKKSLLCLSELEYMIRHVNAAWDEEDCASRTTKHEKRDGAAYVWEDLCLRTLYKLKQSKRKIFSEEEEEPC
jgi:hypothetical protein